MSLKYIALDIGNVCLKLNIPATMAYFGLSQLTPELMMIIDRYERGKCSDAEMLNAFRASTGKNIDDHDIKKGWNLILGDEIEGMNHFVRHAIQLGYHFAFFSDTNPTHFLCTVEKLSFAHLIDGRVTSYEVGFKKPESEMYEAFERLYGTPVLYFDDKEENVLSAQRKHGWHGCVFTTVQNAIEVLDAYHNAHTPPPEEIDDYNV